MPGTSTESKMPNDPPNEMAPRSEETRGFEVAQPSWNVAELRVLRRCSWAWADKAALRRIREAFDASKNVASALGVYYALVEIASDKGTEQFNTTHAWLATISGFSPRTVQERVRELAEIGLIEVHTPSLRAPSTYRLLAVRQPLRSARQPLRIATQRLIRAPLPRSEETERTIEAPTEENVAAATPASSMNCSADDAEWIAELQRDPAYTGIDVPREFAKLNRWCVVNRKQPTRRRFINWLNRVDRPISRQPETPNHAGGF